MLMCQRGFFVCHVSTEYKKGGIREEENENQRDGE